ncbi:MAG: hypothetical protein H7068_05135, partial [Pedobacter sp.]|nr:hypothetical protein [Chitinophagaceae bacterium]
MKKILTSILLMSISLSAFSKDWVLSDSNVKIVFNDQTSLLTVTDKRCNKVWEQLAYKEMLTTKSTVQNGNTLTINFTGKYSFQAIFALTQSSDLEITLMADKNLAMENLAFPAPFKAPNKNHYLLETGGEGLLLPLDDKDYPMNNNERVFFCGGGATMAWMGIVDTAFKTGYMAILETPYDAILQTKRENGIINFSPVWMPSMGLFGYNRKVTYHFFNEGGYVAQCKKYRAYSWAKNKVITLIENEKKTPALAKMIGAVHLYVWDNARQVSFAQELKKSGIDKAFFLWDANHTPYPEIGYDNKLKELGYAAGVYDLYTDLHYKDTAYYEVDENGPLRFSRSVYPAMFNELAAHKKNGKTYFNQFGHTISPAAIRPQIIKRVERELKEFPHEAYFLDVYQANGLFEDYSPTHTLSRQQFAEEIIKNYKLVSEKYHQFMGGEWGADFTGSNSVFNHGMMTLHRTWWGSEIEKKGTVYWTGDWKNNQRPSQMLGTRVAPDKYLKYSINEYTRVPLYEL